MKAMNRKAPSSSMRRLSMTMLQGAGHRVVTARMQGMAAADAAGGEPAAFPGAVFFDGFDGVERAAGLEAAARTQQWAHEIPIQADGDYQEALHRLITSCQCQSRLARSSALSRRPAAARACTTMSTAGNPPRWRRKLSRTVRLMRLRCVAAATAFFATASPSRAVAVALPQASTTKHASLLRV